MLERHGVARRRFVVMGAGNGYFALAVAQTGLFENTIARDITPPEHLQYFNPGSIATLLARTGFQPVDITTPGILDVDIVKRHRNERGLPLAQANAYLDHLLARDDAALHASLQRFLACNKLSSHMLAFAVRS